MLCGFRSQAIRIVTFSALWILLHVAAVFVNLFFIHAAGVIYLAGISLVLQLPIAVTLYLLFDLYFQDSVMFQTRPGILLAVGLAGSFVLYYPSLLLVLKVMR